MRVRHFTIRSAVVTFFLVVGGMFAAAPAIASTSTPTATPPPAPTGVHAVFSSNNSVVITWRAAAVSPKQVGGYIVERNGTKLTQLTADGHGGPTSYTDPRPPAGTDTYDVATFAPSGVAGPHSPPVELSITASALGNNGSGNNLGPASADAIGPNFRGSNSPTAFEEYAQAVGQVNETYGIGENPFNVGFMMELQFIWYFVVMHAYLALSFLAWGLTKKFYAPLITVVTNFVTAYFKMPLYSSVTSLLVALAVASLLVYLFKGHISRFMRGLAVILLVLLGMTAYTTWASPFIQTVMNYPVQVGDYVLGQVDQILPDKPGAGNYNLQVHPTFVGNPFEQQTRHFLTDEWETDVWPTVCQLNFGDVHWATTHFVPDDPGANPRWFHHLTYCEFYVRTVVHGGAERDYLTSQVNKVGGQVWEMYQGNNLPRHYWIAFLGGLVITIRSLFVDLLAFSFVLGEILLGIWLVKLALLGMGMAIKEIAPITTDWARRMVVTAHVPIVGAIIAVIGLAFSNELMKLAPQYGWTASMVYQLVVAVGMVVALLMIWFRRRRARQERIRIDGTRRAPPEGGGLAGAAVTAATIAGAAATGGTSAAAGAAGKQGARRAAGSVLPRPNRPGLTGSPGTAGISDSRRPPIQGRRSPGIDPGPAPPALPSGGPPAVGGRPAGGRPMPPPATAEVLSRRDDVHALPTQPPRRVRPGRPRPALPPPDRDSS